MYESQSEIISSGFTESVVLPKKTMNKKVKQTIFAFSLLGPVLVLYLLFFIFPFLFSTILSVADWDMISKQITFVGLENYIEIIKDSALLQVLKNTCIYTMALVVGSLTLGLSLAMLISKLSSKKLKSLYRSVLFFPSITSLAVMGIVWKIIMDPSNGMLNAFIGFFGAAPVNWLFDSKWAMVSVIIVGIWNMLGYSIVIFTAALNEVNASLYESIDADGGGSVTKFIHVTIPQISPTLFFMFITSIIHSFKAFESVIVMTRGGPFNATNVIGYKIWQEGFQFFDSGKANALSILLFAVLLTAVVLTVRTLESKVNYD